MADMAKMGARIRELEARRARGESVPELDALYQRMDAMTNKGYTEATKAVTGEAPAAPIRKAAGGQAKVGKVMREFKAGSLKSSSGQKVTNPKQAIAIGLSEAGLSRKAKGGEMKESKAMVKKEVSFMKKKGAPKAMIKHEMAEAGMKPKAKYMSFTEKGKPAGMKPVQMAKGGVAASKMGSVRTAAPSRDGVAMKGKTKGAMVKMAGSTKGLKKGGYC